MGKFRPDNILQETQRLAVHKTLQACNGNQKRAARVLGCHRETIKRLALLEPVISTWSTNYEELRKWRDLELQQENDKQRDTNEMYARLIDKIKLNRA